MGCPACQPSQKLQWYGRTVPPDRRTRSRAAARASSAYRIGPCRGKNAARTRSSRRRLSWTRRRSPQPSRCPHVQRSRSTSVRTERSTWSVPAPMSRPVRRCTSFGYVRDKPPMSFSAPRWLDPRGRRADHSSIRAVSVRLLRRGEPGQFRGTPHPRRIGRRRGSVLARAGEPPNQPRVHSARDRATPADGTDKPRVTPEVMA